MGIMPVTYMTLLNRLVSMVSGYFSVSIDPLICAQSAVVSMHAYATPISLWQKLDHYMTILPLKYVPILGNGQGTGLS